MPNYVSGELIKEIRNRKGWQQLHLQNISPNETNLLVTLSRVENQQQQPTYETVSNFMELLEMPLDQFFCPYLENQPPETYQLRNQLLFYLERAAEDDNALGLSIELLCQLSNELDTASVVNRQFIISCQARINEASQLTENTETLCKEGIQLTYPEFNEQNFNGEILDFEEPELLHTLALVYRRTDRMDKAISLLSRIIAGITRLSQSETAKEKRLPRIQNTLVNLLIEQGEYEKALEMCRESIDVCIKRDKAFYVPKFAYSAAVCAFHLNNKSECAEFLRHSYYSYGLLGMAEQMKKVEADANALFDIDIDTHHIEHHAFNQPLNPFAQSASNSNLLPCDNIGGLIRQFRLQAKAKPKDIYTGICSKALYSMIESGMIQQANTPILTALFQRLGRDIDLYYNAFLSKAEFEESQLEHEIRELLSVRKHEEAEVLLNKLSQYKSSQKGLGLQRYKYSDAICQNLKEAGAKYLQSGYSASELLMRRRLEALKITIPDYNEELIHTYRLTDMEFNIIHSLAIYNCTSGELQRGLEMFRKLRESILTHKIDVNSQGNFIPILMSNYSFYTSEAGQYEKALVIALEGEAVCIRYGLYYLLPLYAINKSIYTYKLGREDESRLHLTMAYYGSCLTGHKAIKTCCKKRKRKLWSSV